MNHTIVDVESWERRDLFRLYTTKLKIVMNATVKLDVTPLVRFRKKHGLRFYPLMMWVVGKLMNAHDEFKYHLTEEGELWRWDSVSPSYTDFHKDTGRFVKFATEYSTDLWEFHERCVRDMEAHGEESGFLPGIPNVFDVSCLPWITYDELSLTVDEGRSTLYPVVLWGKYERHLFRTRMPVTLKINHAVCDGYHLSRFFLELQQEINNIGKVKKP